MLFIVLDMDTLIQIQLDFCDEYSVHNIRICRFDCCEFDLCKRGHSHGHVGFQGDIVVALVPTMGKNHLLGRMV